MTQDYSTRLTSRFCHDIANPLGAIGNGLELVTLSGLQPGPEVSLIEDSIAQATATLKRFRLAFGACECAIEERSEFTDQLRTVWNNASRIQMSTSGQIAISLPQQKLICLLALCCENSLPFGGNVDLRPHEAGFSMAGTGRKVKWDDMLWAHVLSPCTATSDLAPAQLHFMTAGTFAAGLGYKIAADLSDDQITITAQI